MEEENIRYPIGMFTPRVNSAPEDRVDYITEIAKIVPTLHDTIKKCNTTRLHTPYRTNGWTPHEIIHHLADNDMNAFIRLKRALTEIEPQAASYREDLWAELNDYKQTPVLVSIHLLEAIHFRIMKLLEGLNAEDYDRKLRTNALGWITVDTAIQRFIWHNHHHTSQIQEFINRIQKYDNG